jgi:hypothetical protein
MQHASSITNLEAIAGMMLLGRLRLFICIGLPASVSVGAEPTYPWRKRNLV